MKLPFNLNFNASRIELADTGDDIFLSMLCNFTKFGIENQDQ